MKKRISIGTVIFNIINYSVYVLITLLCIFPLYYIVVLSVSNNDVVSSGKLLLFPRGFHLQNYINVITMKGLPDALIISVLRTIIGTVLTVIASSFVAYMFVQKKMFARTFLYRMLIISMYFNAGLIPWFITMKNLHLTNTFLAYILPYMVAPFFVILIKTYIESIPPSLEESATLDGAGTMVVYTRIILPVSKPILATVAVFESVNQWNNFTDNLFLNTSPKLTTLQLKLYLYLSEVDSIAQSMRESGNIAASNPAVALTPTAIRMTMAVLVVIPILFVYPFLQRYFVKGIMVGAIKG